jgi:alkylation response protein AidB-like acyl-CoA dehydrogenase
MPTYSPPLRDIRFTFEHVAGLDEIAKLEDLAHADLDSAMEVVAEFGRFCVDKLLPLNRTGDVTGSKVVDGRVVTPPGFKEAYQDYFEAGWNSVPFDQGYGGGGFPWMVALAMQEILNSVNMSFALCPLLTQGFIELLTAHGTEDQKQRYLTKLISGEWSGTMNLTEPDAGSDVGALRTKAVQQDDGTYRISGTKIFITFGDHDMAENIVHLVLARVPGAPPGTKGISLFIVPATLVDANGELGERNTVTTVSVEHKMGIHASPTCVLEFDGAVGELVLEEQQGMRGMFTMMNNARLSVGTQGLGLCEAAYQAALDYAKVRLQGRAVGASAGTSSPIIEHPDVRRMLLTMKAYTEAARALCYYNARQVDLAHHHADADARTAAAELGALLTPLSKAWGTDLANEITSLGVQVHGGMGFIEETGVAQLYRDARIAAIYEGTNGIQAIDLVLRKVPLRGGGVLADLVGKMRATASELDSAGDLASIGVRLTASLGTLDRAVAWLSSNAADPEQALAAATPFLRLLSQVVGGWLLGVEALAAARALSGGQPDDEAFLETKVATAKFYADHLLPTVDGLLATITAGKADLFQIPAAAL